MIFLTTQLPTFVTLVQARWKSPLQVQEKQSTFLRHAQRNAFRRRDARQQSRSIAETQPQLQPALLRFSAMISQLRFTPQFCLFCSSHRAEPAAYRVEISCADHTATIHRSIKTKSDLLTARIKSIHRSEDHFLCLASYEPRGA